MKEDFLFTYGLLRKKANHEMGRFLSDSAVFLAEATYQGHLYLIDYYPGVIPTEDISKKVIGEVFSIRDKKLLEELDRFEGIGPAFPSPNEYRRELQEVQIKGGKTMEAWVYLYNRPVAQYPIIDSGDFLLRG
ncbi:MAG: gamma-glutamylcyclotransferase family protein [Bacteroidota bacterium]